MRAYVLWLDTLQQAITPDMLAGCQGVLRFTETLRRGYVAEASVTVENPGLALLKRSTYLAVLVSMDDTPASAKVIARCRISGAPESGTGLTVTLPLVCAPASHAQDLRAAANASVRGAGIPPYTVKVVPTPDPPGSVAVAFASSPGAAWAGLRAGAVKALSVIQEDVIRTPFRFVSWRVLDVANARLFVTLPDTPALRARLAANRYMHLALSGSASPQDATQTYVVGRVMGWDGALRDRLDVEVNLSDPSLLPGATPLSTATDLTAAALPTYDPLFEQGSEDLGTAALQGRTCDWNTDPVTHQISLDDWTTSDRVVNLGAGGFDFRLDYTPQSPVRHVRARLVAEWQQQAVGVVNLAPLIGLANASTGGRMLSLTTERVEGVGGFATDFASVAGWSQDKASLQPSYLVSEPFWTGRTLEITYQLETITYVPNENGGLDSVVVKGAPYARTHDEHWTMNVRGVAWNYFYAGYSYSQQRRETVDLVLDVDTQTTTLGGDTLDLGPVTLGDLLAVSGIAPWQDGTVYHRGDRVLVAGEAFECLNDNTLSFYRFAGRWNPSKLNVTGIGASGPHPDWKRLGTCAPLPDRRLPSYFDTARGRGSISHMLLRMRAAALKRLQHILVARTYPWADAADVRLTDRVRMVIRDAQGKRAVVGKVQSIERVLDGRKGGTIRIQIAASLGTGRDDRVPERPLAGAYGGAGYFPPEYHEIRAPSYVAPSFEVDDASVYSVGTDVEFSLNGDPLIVPVDATRLQDPNYACLEVFVRNPAARQLALMQGRSAQGGDPREVTKEFPTTLRIAMRPLIAEGNLQRFTRCHAQLTRSPRGVRLEGDGEP